MAIAGEIVNPDVEYENIAGLSYILLGELIVMKLLMIGRIISSLVAGNHLQFICYYCRLIG